MPSWSLTIRCVLGLRAATSLLALGSGAARADPPAAVDVDRRLSIRTIGAGPDVVLIPGLASSAHVWDHEAARLAARYRVHVVQVRGFAGTSAGANATGPVIVPVVMALHDAIVRAGIAPVAVIGHSLGGLVGMELALAHPADVRSLLIVDSLPFLGEVFGAADAATAGARVAPMREQLEHESQAAYAAGAGGIAPRMVRTTGPAAEAVTAASAASDHAVVARAMYEDATSDLRRDVAAIRAPVTVLYPWDDRSNDKPAEIDRFYTRNTPHCPARVCSASMAAAISS